MEIGLFGSGPAAESIRGACEDVGATVTTTDRESMAEYDAIAVVAPPGSGAFGAAGAAVDRWVAVETGGIGGRVLPIDAGVSAYDEHSGCYDCLRARVGSNLGEQPRSEDPSGDPNGVRVAGALAGRELVLLANGHDRGGTVHEVPGPEREFLPVPGCECGADRDRTVELAARESNLDETLERAERALDDRVGLVSNVGERESFPVPYYIARTADTTVFSDVRAGEFAAGVDPDWDRAFMKALGEGLERYAAGVYRAREFTTAPERTRASPVAPRAFVRPEDAATPDVETPIPWTDGIDLGSEQSVSLPAAFVHYPPPNDRYGPAITTGLGLGSSSVDAVLAGLYEVVERDATMLSWYSTFEPMALETDDEYVQTLRKRARAENLEATLLLLTQDVDVPVVGAAVHREDEWPQFAMGSGADLDATAAAGAALAEALQNWMELRAMGRDAASEESAAIGTHASFPSQTRAFVDTDATVHASDVGPADHPSGRAELDALVDRVREAGLDAYAARLTTRDLETIGFEAYRTLVPSAQPLFVGEPFFGERAETVPRELGFEPRLDREYHPFP
jgi:ribosomal protein S12 methylthiotransferase accessory factor